MLSLTTFDKLDSAAPCRPHGVVKRKPLVTRTTTESTKQSPPDCAGESADQKYRNSFDEVLELARKFEYRQSAEGRMANLELDFPEAVVCRGPVRQRPTLVRAGSKSSYHGVIHEDRHSVFLEDIGTDAESSPVAEQASEHQRDKPRAAPAKGRGRRHTVSASALVEASLKGLIAQARRGRTNR